MAFMDDITVVSDNREATGAFLDRPNELIEWTRMNVKVKKSRNAAFVKTVQTEVQDRS